MVIQPEGNPCERRGRNPISQGLVELITVETTGFPLVAHSFVFICPGGSKDETLKPRASFTTH